VFDLDTGVDLDEVVPALLINQEFRSTSVSVVDRFGELDGIVQDGLSNLFREVGSRSNFNDLLVSSLDGAVSFVQVYAVAMSISQELDFDVSRVVEESYIPNGLFRSRRRVVLTP
jgi:hypothetical protein